MKPAAGERPLAGLGAAWARLAARERRLALLALAVVGLALLWWLALAPALATLRQAETQRRALDLQWQRMQALQAEAEALKASPRMAHDAALRALEASVKQRLGASAQLAVVGERANLTLKDAPAAELAAWLAEARVDARAVPLEARLTRAAGASAGRGTQWSGTLSLSLPPQ